LYRLLLTCQFPDYHTKLNLLIRTLNEDGILARKLGFKSLTIQSVTTEAMQLMCILHSEIIRIMAANKNCITLLSPEALQLLLASKNPMLCLFPEIYGLLKEEFIHKAEPPVLDELAKVKQSDADLSQVQLDAPLSMFEVNEDLAAIFSPRKASPLIEFTMFTQPPMTPPKKTRENCNGVTCSLI
jgi:hypothetical protein